MSFCVECSRLVFGEVVTAVSLQGEFGAYMEETEEFFQVPEPRVELGIFLSLRAYTKGEIGIFLSLRAYTKGEIGIFTSPRAYMK